MAKINKQLQDAVTPLSPAELKQVVRYARALRQSSAERKTTKPRKRTKSPKKLEETDLGKLILKLESLGDLGFPPDFGSQIDHYAWGTPKRVK
jgi:hypothetical protein